MGYCLSYMALLLQLYRTIMSLMNIKDKQKSESSVYVLNSNSKNALIYSVLQLFRQVPV